MKKKILLFLCAMCTALAAHAAITYTVDGFQYELEYGTATLKKCYKTGDVIIPASVSYQGEDYTVTGIKDAFGKENNLTSVTIPESVRVIGDYAFSGCSNLKSITIPKSVISIEGCAFKDCSSLQSINIPEGVTTLNGTFKGCSSLKSINIPEGVTTLNGTFEGCSSLKSINIPEGVTTLNGTFEGCSSLQSVNIPKGVTEIGSRTFQNCSSLKEIIVPEGVTSIGQEAFYGCSSLQSLTIPSSVTEFTSFTMAGGHVFDYCTGTLYFNCPLTNTTRYTFNNLSFERIVLGDAVTSLPYEVFLGKAKVKEVVLPNTLTTIGGRALEGCSGLQTITIPESVATIESRAFYGCSGLQNINLPQSVTSIASSAFTDCAGTLRVEGNIGTALGDNAFEQIILAPSVSAIGESAFASSRNACFVVEAETPPTLSAKALPDAPTFIYVPKGKVETYQAAWGQPTSIGYTKSTNTYHYLEQGTEGLSGTCGEHLTWSFDPLTGHLFIAGSGAITENPWISFASKIRSLSLPEGLTSICYRAFYGCQLTELQLSKICNSIGAYAFYNNKLTEITIPEGITTIAANAFQSNHLVKITLPSTLTKIEQYAFNSYTQPQEIHIFATTPPTLGSNVFYKPSKPTYPTFVYIPENTTAAYQAAWGTDYSYIEPNGAADITGIIGGNLSWTFNPYSGKLSITGTGAMPDYGKNDTNIPWYKYRNYITSVELSEGITAVGNYAFSNLPYITELIVPASVTKIGYNILQGSGATSLHYQSPTATVGYYFNSGVINSSMGGWMIGTPSDDAMLTGSQIEHITLGENVTEIPPFFFANDTVLRSIVIPNTVTKIGGGAFFRCRNLRSVTLPEHLTRIDTAAFQESGIDTLILPMGVTRICRDAFWNSGLKHIELPESVTELEEGAFAGCHLDALRIPDGVTSLPFYLLTEAIVYSWSYSSVGSLTIGKGVTEVSENIFKNCTIDTIHYNARKAEYTGDGSYPGSVFEPGVAMITIGDSVEVIPERLCYKTNITEITLPNSVTEIGKLAFAKCPYLSKVVMSDSVTSIGVGAFSQCYALSTIYLPEGLLSIPSSMFNSCYSLPSITLPKHIRTIGEYAFSECSSLESVFIPSSVHSVWEKAFYKCTNLKSLTFHGSYIGEQAFYGCTQLASVEFTSGVSIDNQVFYQCNALEKLHIKENETTNIGNLAFFECHALDTLVIPDYSYTTIGTNAFANCTGLQSVSLGNSVQSVGAGAFSGCYNLNELSLYSRCSLEDKAFADCPSITHIYNHNETPNSCSASVFDGLDKFSCTLHVPEGTTEKYRIASVWRDFYYMEEMLPTYTIVVESESEDMGSVSGGGTYHSGTEITIVATPAEGYRFVQWSDGNTENPRVITVTENTTYLAMFEEAYFTLTTDCDDNQGYVTGGGRYKEGSAVTVTATPAHDYWFTQWNDGNTDNPRTIVLTQDTTLYAHFARFRTLTTGCNPNHGIVTEGGSYTENTEITLTATAYLGYHFVRWSDGNTDNPRTLVLTQDISLTAEFAMDYSGQCGDNLYWFYKQNELKIMGMGIMYDYTEATQPWLLFKDSVQSITTDNTTGSIGEYAFANLSQLTNLHLGAGIETIAANAFAGCVRLVTIYSYATLPPHAEVSSFADYNAHLYVPCNVLEDYQKAIIFSSFKYIECISSEDVTLSSDGVTVIPSTTNATFTWPVNSSAESYELVITKDGVTFCTLVFNANGQLTGIAFAPARDRDNVHTTPAAKALVNGWQFTVTGLNEKSDYAYALTVSDKNDKVLKSYEGTFSTLGEDLPDGLDTPTEGTTSAQKILRDGQVLIQRGDKVYTLTGQEIVNN